MRLNIALILKPSSRGCYLAQTILTLIHFIPSGRAFGAILGRGGRISSRWLRKIKRRHILPTRVTLVLRFMHSKCVRRVWPFLLFVRLIQSILTIISLSLHILVVRVDKIVVIYFYVKSSFHFILQNGFSEFLLINLYLLACQIKKFSPRGFKVLWVECFKVCHVILLAANHRHRVRKDLAAPLLEAFFDRAAPGS